MKLRRIASAVVATTIALALAGCGTKAGSPVSSACDNSKPVLIGQLAPLTGPSADLGILTRDGAEIGVEQVNKAGGVMGHCLQISVKDDQGDPTKSSQAARQLVDQEGVVAIIGPVLSSPTAASLEVTTKAPIIQMVNSSLYAASVAKNFPYSFMDEFTQLQSVEAMVNFLKRQQLKKIAAIGVNNALGTYYADAMPGLLKGTGIDLVAPVALFQSGSVDLTAQMRPLADAKPQAILTFLAAVPDSVAVVKARNQLAPGVPLIGTGALANAGSTGALTASDMDKVYSGPFPKNLSYRKGETKAVGAKADAFLNLFRTYRKVDTLTVSASQAMSAYDAVGALASAINGAKSTDAKKLQTWFESSTYDGAGGNFKWTSDSHAGHLSDQAAFVVASTLKNGMLQLAPGEEK